MIDKWDTYASNIQKLNFFLLPQAKKIENEMFINQDGEGKA